MNQIALSAPKFHCRAKLKALSVLLVSIALLVGCTTPRQPTRIDTSFVQVGATSREKVIDRWGEPAEYYEDGLILAYRVTNSFPAKPEKGDEEFTRGSVGSAFYNYILVFNEQGQLLKFKRIKLRRK